MAYEETCKKKRFVNLISYSNLYMFMKKEENFSFTIYKIEIIHAQQRA